MSFVKIVLLSIILIIINISYVSAGAYHCLNKTTPNDICCLKTRNRTIGKDYYVRGCEKDEICGYYISEDEIHCIKKSKNKLQNEKCEEDSECLSGMCKDKKCFAYKIGEKCSEDKQCTNTAFCNENNKCQLLLKAGDKCNHTIGGCFYGYGCGQKEKEGEYTCIRYFSLKNSRYSNNKLFCRSNRLSEDNLCYETQSKFDYNNSKDCSVDSTDCPSYNELTKSLDFNECLLNWKSENYCDFTSNATNWEYFLELFNKYVDNYIDGSIHVAEYTKHLGDYDFFNNYELSRAYMNASVKFFKTEKCVLDYYTSKGR